MILHVANAPGESPLDMKLDRNLNPDGRGKYALLKLRRTALPLSEIRNRINGCIGGQILQFGDNPDTEFFVIKLIDKFAGPALRAYAEAARSEDPEYAAEIDALALSAESRTFKKMPD
jgi:hypothetical protein